MKISLSPKVNFINDILIVNNSKAVSTVLS